MKKTLSLLAAFLVMNVTAFAQNNVNLIIFAEDGDAFYAYVNGIKQNQKPESNVRIAGISPNISLRIEFENKALPQLKQNMSLEPGFEHTARIKRDKNQQVKLRYFGQVPMEQAAAEKSVPTVNYHTSETAAQTSNAASDQNANMSVTSTTTTTQMNNGRVDNTSVNVTMPGVGITMNINDPVANTTMQSSSSTTVTTTSSSTYNDNNASTSPAPVKATQEAKSTECTTAMTAPNFTKMKESVSSKPFSDTKMTTAKVATKNACLSVSQVKEIAKLFSMDEDKLTYAKYAYDYCVDKANYYQVSEVFSFSTTTDDFNKFLEK